MMPRYIKTAKGNTWRYNYLACYYEIVQTGWDKYYHVGFRSDVITDKRKLPEFFGKDYKVIYSFNDYLKQAELCMDKK